MSTENQVAVVGMSNLPADVQALMAGLEGEFAAAMNKGRSAELKTKGTRFMVVTADGKEEVLESSKIKGAIIRCRKDIVKSFYAAAYNPNSTEVTMPDCFSNDGVAPDASIPSPMNATCAACPMNAFGSGKDQNGAATAGKGCSDRRLLALYIPGADIKARFGSEIFKLSLPPGSLTEFGKHVRNITSRGGQLPFTMTEISLDPAKTTAKFLFAAAGTIDPSMFGAVAIAVQSAEAVECITADMKYKAPEGSTAPAKAQTATPTEVAQPAAPKAAAPVVTETVIPAPPEMGMSMGEPVVEVPTEAVVVERVLEPEVVTSEPTVTVTVEATAPDAAVADALGLNFSM